jgi:hypothetical protein
LPAHRLGEAPEITQTLRYTHKERKRKEPEREKRKTEGDKAHAFPFGNIPLAQTESHSKLHPVGALVNYAASDSYTKETNHPDLRGCHQTM